MISDYLTKLKDSTVATTDLNFFKVVTLTDDKLSQADLDAGVNSVWVYLNRDNSIRIQKNLTAISYYYAVSADGKLSCDTADFDCDKLVLDTQPWSTDVDTIKQQVNVDQPAAKQTLITDKTTAAKTDLADYLQKLLNLAGTTDTYYYKYVTLSDDNLSTADKDAGVTAIRVGYLRDGRIQLQKTGGDSAGYQVSADNKLSVASTLVSFWNNTLENITWTDTLSAITTQVASLDSTQQTKAVNDLTTYLDKLNAAPMNSNDSYQKYAALSGEDITQEDRDAGVTLVKIYLNQSGSIGLEKSGVGSSSYLLKGTSLAIQDGSYVQTSIVLISELAADTVTAIKQSVIDTETARVSQAKTEIGDYLTIFKDVTGTQDVTFLKIATLTGDNIKQTDRDAGVTSVWVYLKNDNTIRVQKNKSSSLISYEVSVDGKLTLNTDDFDKRGIVLDSQPWSDTVATIKTAQTDAVATARQNEIDTKTATAQSEIDAYLQKLIDLPGFVDTNFYKYVTLTGDNRLQADKDAGITAVRIAYLRDGRVTLQKTGGDFASYQVYADNKLSMASTGTSFWSNALASIPWTDKLTTLSNQASNLDSTQKTKAVNDLTFYLDKLNAAPMNSNDSYVKIATLTGEQILQADRDAGVTSVKIYLNQSGGIGLEKTGTPSSSYLLKGTTLAIQSSGYLQTSISLDAEVATTTVNAIKQAVADAESAAISLAKTEIGDYLVKLNNVAGDPDSSFVKVATLIGDNIAQLDRDAGVTSVWVYLKTDNSIRVQKNKSSSSTSYEIAVDGKLTLDTADFDKRGIVVESPPWTDTVASIKTAQTDGKAASLETERQGVLDTASLELSQYLGILNEMTASSSETYAKFALITGDKITGTDKTNGVTSIQIAVRTNGEISLTKLGSKTANGNIMVKTNSEMDVQLQTKQYLKLIPESPAPWANTLLEILAYSACESVRAAAAATLDDSQFKTVDNVMTITVAGKAYVLDLTNKTLTIPGKTTPTSLTDSLFNSLKTTIENNQSSLAKLESDAATEMADSALLAVDDSQIVIDTEGLYTMQINGKTYIFDNNTKELTSSSGRRFTLENSEQISKITTNAQAQHDQALLDEQNALSDLETSLAALTSVEQIRLDKNIYSLTSSNNIYKFNMAEKSVITPAGIKYLIASADKLAELTQAIGNKERNLLESSIKNEVELYIAILKNKTGQSFTLNQLEFLKLKKMVTLTGDEISEADRAKGVTQVIASLSQDDKVLVEKKKKSATLERYMAKGTYVDSRRTVSGKIQSTQLQLSSISWQTTLDEIDSQFVNIKSEAEAKAAQAKLDLEAKKEAEKVTLSSIEQESLENSAKYYQDKLNADTSNALTDAQKKSLNIEKMTLVSGQAISETDRNNNISEVRIYINSSNLITIIKRSGDKVVENTTISNGIVNFRSELGGQIRTAEIDLTNKTLWQDALLQIEQKIIAEKAATEQLIADQKKAAEDLAKLMEADSEVRGAASYTMNIYTEKLKTSPELEYTNSQKLALGLKKVSLFLGSDISAADRAYGIDEVRVTLTVFNTIIIEKRAAGRTVEKLIAGENIGILLTSRTQGKLNSYSFKQSLGLMFNVIWVVNLRKLRGEQ